MGAGTSHSTEAKAGSGVTDTMGPPLSLDQAACLERDWRSAQVVIVAEMIESIDALTNAGQRHRMGRVIQFLEVRLSWRFPPGSRQGVSRMLGRLTEEAARSMPRIRPFQVRARALLGLAKTTES